MNPIALERLRAQLIVGAHEHAAPEDVVAHLGAVQAQEYPSAKWAVGLRCAKRITDSDVEEAVNSGRILRTHAFRGTWQLMCPADLRWMCALVAPTLARRTAARSKQLGLDEATYARSNKAIERAVRDGGELTRQEIGAALKKSRIAPDGQRLAHLLFRAELEGVVCSGARRGKQATYALVDMRCKKARSLARERALEELARRYFVSRGPATLADFVWWSGLPVKDARAGVEGAHASLGSEVIDGVTYFRSKTPWKKSKTRASRVHLLPAFDEYLVAYKNREAQITPADVKRVNAGGGLLAPVVLVDGHVVGLWRPAVRLFSKRSPVELKEAIAAYEAFRR